MAMNLGLENLIDKPAEQPKAGVIENGVFYEYLDAAFEYNDACEELTIVFDRGETLFRAAANLKAVAEYIAQEGITPALEALVGENFENGLTEASVEAAKEGVWAKIKEWFIQLWNAIKQFFLKMFANVDKQLARLHKWIEKANSTKESDFSGHEFYGISGSFIGGITKLITNFVLKSEIKKYEGDSGKKIVSMYVGEAYQTLPFSLAKTYAQKLYVALTAVKKFQGDFIKTCDERIKAAKKIESDEDKEKEQAIYNKSKEFVNQLAKRLVSTTAAFLAHNTFSGKGEAGEKEESDSSKKQLPESQKPRESNSDDK